MTAHKPIMTRFSKLLSACVLFGILETPSAHSFQRSPSREKSTTKTERVPKSEPITHQLDSQTETHTPEQAVVFICRVVELHVGLPEESPYEVEVPSPYPPLKDPIMPSLWYAGIQFGGMFPHGDIADEYDRGSSFKILAGGIFPARLGVELEFQTGSLSGTPQFDYVTTTNYAYGSVRTVKEIPQATNATLNSLGIRATYQFLKKERHSVFIEGWMLGITMRYVWLTEESELERETHFNGVLESSERHTVNNSFGTPQFGFDVARTVSVGTDLWVDLVIGYDISLREAPRVLPTAFDWNAYRGLTLDVGFRIRLANTYSDF